MHPDINIGVHLLRALPLARPNLDRNLQIKSCVLANGNRHAYVSTQCQSYHLLKSGRLQHRENHNQRIQSATVLQDLVFPFLDEIDDEGVQRRWKEHETLIQRVASDQVTKGSHKNKGRLVFSTGVAQVEFLKNELAQMLRDMPDDLSSAKATKYVNAWAADPDRQKRWGELAPGGAQALTGTYASGDWMTRGVGAEQASAPLSIHPLRPTMDAMNAVDDLHPGSAHMGDKEIASLVFYQHLNYNINQLHQSSRERGDDLRDFLRTRILDVIRVTPASGSRALNGQALPFTLLISKDDHPSTNLFYDAFSKPLGDLGDQDIRTVGSNRLLGAYERSVHANHGLIHQNGLYQTTADGVLDLAETPRCDTLVGVVDRLVTDDLFEAS